MSAKANLISCNFSTCPSLTHGKTSLQFRIQTQKPEPRISPYKITSGVSVFSEPRILKTLKSPFQRKGRLQICRSTLKTRTLEEKDLGEGGSSKSGGVGDGNGGGGGGGGGDWTTSIVLFVFWGALMYYVFFLTPNQTPSRDMYFLKKLLNLKGDDGFRMNEVLVSLWYMMGLWPLVYGMLLLPAGRSSKSNIPVWPFVVLSCFGGVYALLPYFVLWKPPAPPVDETQLRTWPLNFLESKVTAGVSLAAGLAIFIYAGLANGDVWKEFFQYFRESKFIHVTCLDFTLLSAFAPFWVYNDMTVRKWFEKGSWLLPISVVPFLGPALYLLLRPSLSTMSISPKPAAPEPK
ncbi:Cardiolipin synthase N-terminal [Quillaja saponaria]|uniref:Cardiolipin synthase N-terminal n=1 Tax=Quillaja saponaria TaxID=32244 RepID=A0AAD7PQQ3_QUISA|nr:Cardiolipin synthase N-terminal [Quillaja saponaria]